MEEILQKCPHQEHTEGHHNWKVQEEFRVGALAEGHADEQQRGDENSQHVIFKHPHLLVPVVLCLIFVKLDSILVRDEPRSPNECFEFLVSEPGNLGEKWFFNIYELVEPCMHRLLFWGQNVVFIGHQFSLFIWQVTDRHLFNQIVRLYRVTVV